MGAQRLQIRVLGPFEVQVDDDVVPLGGRQQRLLLAALAASVNQVVSSDALVDILWDDGASADDGTSRLAKVVYRLRSALEAAGVDDCVHTRAPGYVLSVPPDVFDGAMFTDLLKRAHAEIDPLRAVSLLDEALALWRGAAWADVADHEFVRAEAARLEGLRAVALEDRGSAMLAAGRHLELVPQLEACIERYPLRERFRGQLMVALFWSDRQAEAMGAYRTFRDHLRDEMGLEPSPALQQLMDGIAQRQLDPPRWPPGARDDSASSTREAPCPYKGLASFTTGDRAYFAGRQRLTDELVARLAVDPFLAVVGPSGCGKSSLVAAGLFGALQAGALPGSERWTYRLLRPGASPIDALAAIVARLAGADAPDLAADLAAQPAALEHAVNSALHDQPDGRVVLAVDQFEEVFTVCSDRNARTAFIDALVQHHDRRLVVVLAMRADYYGACAEHAELSRLLSRHQVLVSAMTAAELRSVVTEPATAAGLMVEDGLAEKVAEDAAGAPGALPLVSTALLETWVRRSQRTLTLAGYAEAGGVRGAVGRLADSVYDALDPEGRNIARRIFLRLAEPEGEHSDVRRRASADEFASTSAEQAVLTELVERRLLTATDDTVEVAHEALLREWPRLRGWLHEDREGRRVHHHLSAAAATWQADQRDDGDLYRGVRLQAAHEWSATHPGDANQLETEFLDASEAAQARTLRDARTRARRFRLLAIGLAVLLVAAAVTGVVALAQRARANHEAAVARSQALSADVGRIAAYASMLPGDQHDTALLLSVEGYRLDPSDETLGGLQAAVVQTPPGLDRVIRYAGGPAVGPHLNSTGTLLAVPDENGVLVYRMRTGAMVRRWRWADGRAWGVFSGDSKYVAAGGRDGEVAIWNLASGRLSGVPLHVGGTVALPIFDPVNDDRVYTVNSLWQVSVWDRSDPQHPHRIGPVHSFQGGENPDGVPWVFITISADGRLLAAGSPLLGPTTVWDTRSWKVQNTYPGSAGYFGNSGMTLPISDGQQTVLRNALTNRRIATVRTPQNPEAVLSDDGKYLATVPSTGSNGSSVQVYDVATDRPIGLPLWLGNGSDPIGFLPDDRLLIDGNNAAAVWTVGARLPSMALSLPPESAATQVENAAVFLPHTNQVVTTGYPVVNSLTVHDGTSGRVLGPMLAGRVLAPMAPSPVGTVVVAADRADNIDLWNTATGRRLSQLPGVFDPRLAWSADGRLLATAAGPQVDLWDVSDPRHPKRIVTLPSGSSEQPDAIALSADGRVLLATDDTHKTITAVDTVNHRTLWTRRINGQELKQAVLAPDGSEVAVDSGNSGTGTITAYSTATDRQLGRTATESDGPLAFLDRGNWIVVVSSVGRPGAQIYDARTLQPIGIPFPLPVLSDFVTTNQAGTEFGASGPAVRVWDANPAHWIATACSVAGRNLTPAEWQHYLPNLSYHVTCPQWPSGE